MSANRRAAAHGPLRDLHLHSESLTAHSRLQNPRPLTLTALLCLVASCAALATAPEVRANDLSLLKSLTVDQAAALVKQGKPLGLAVTELPPDVAAALAGAKTELRLNALTEIGPEAAFAVAKHEGQILLPKLAALTPAGARALATHAGELHLPAVTELSPEVATGLAPHAGLLVIGVKELSDEAAAALAKHVGDLRLDGLTSLTSLPLAERVGRQTVVWLGSLRRISPEIARAVSPPVDLKDKSLGYRWIDIGLTELSPEAAAAFVGSRHGFSMHSLESITPEAATALASPFTNMRMWGLKTISPETAAALAKTRGILDIRSFGPELSADEEPAFAAQMQTGQYPAIDFGSLRKLTVPEFAVLVVGPANLHGGLGSVAELGDDAARALAESTHPLKPLPGLTSLTSAALAARYAAQPGDAMFKPPERRSRRIRRSSFRQPRRRPDRPPSGDPLQRREAGLGGL